MIKVILPAILLSTSVYANDTHKPESIWDKSTWTNVVTNKSTDIFVSAPPYLQKNDGLVHTILRVSYKHTGYYDKVTKQTYDNSTINATYDCNNKLISYGSTSWYIGNKNTKTTKGSKILSKMQPVLLDIEKRAYNVVCN